MALTREPYLESCELRLDPTSTYPVFSAASRWHNQSWLSSSVWMDHTGKAVNGQHNGSSSSSILRGLYILLYFLLYGTMQWNTNLLYKYRNQPHNNTIYKYMDQLWLFVGQIYVFVSTFFDVARSNITITYYVRWLPIFLTLFVEEQPFFR